jgi:hypothetical protein
MKLAHQVVLSLGAISCKIDESLDDPQTEEEFKKLDYESNVEITWQQYQEKFEEVKERIGMRILRTQRTILLEQTDWVMTADNFQSLSNKDDWVAYRKMLRDLPTNHPLFIWKKIGMLDFEKMGIPNAPPILRNSDNTS